MRVLLSLENFKSANSAPAGSSESLELLNMLFQGRPSILLAGIEDRGEVELP